MCRVANQQPRLPRGTSSLALNACRGGASTASLGNLFSASPQRDAPSIPGGVQGQVGWSPGQPGLVLHVSWQLCLRCGHWSFAILEFPSNPTHSMMAPACDSPLLCFPSPATTTTQQTGGPTTAVTVTATGATITAVSEESPTTTPSTGIPTSTGAPGTATAATGAAKAAGVSTGGGGGAAGPLVAPHR